MIAPTTRGETERYGKEPGEHGESRFESHDGAKSGGNMLLNDLIDYDYVDLMTCADPSRTFLGAA